MPIVSVVMPAYNAGKYIALAFDSLIAQTFSEWECVVVNDGSTDDTLAIIKKYAEQESRIRYKSIINTGSAKIPRDTAISMAHSSWIVNLDADDTLEVEAIEKLFFRQQQTGADIVLLRMQLTDEQGNLKQWRTPSASFDFSQILPGLNAASLTIGQWVISGNGALISKRIYDSREPIKNYMNADEYDTRQMLILADKVAFVDAIYYYRDAPESITRSFSIKLFDTLHVNRLLHQLAVRKYGNNSPEATITNKCMFGDIVGKRLLLLRNKDKLTPEQYQALSLLIKDIYTSIDNRSYIFDSRIKYLLIANNYCVFLIVTYLYAKIKR